VSTLLTSWRAALVAHLETAFPNAEVISGRRAGVSRDLDRLCVFWPGWQEDAADVYFARPSMIVRYWPARSKQPTDNPNDPGQLEQAAIDLMTSLETVQKPGDLVPNLYCRVARVTPDYDPEEWGVEAELTSWTVNLATQPAP
jgi:hypothetical protein